MDSIALINIVLLLGSGLVVAGIASSLIASRFGAPLLLVFLGVGMLAGEDGPGGLQFENYQATYLIGSLALAIILFDGGLRSRLSVLRGALVPAGVLATLGVVITAGLLGVVASVALGLSWLEGLLVGAIVASTDAAAVFFLVRTGGLQLRRRVNATLELESGTNDPIAVFLTLAFVQLLAAGGSVPGWAVLVTLAKQGLIGAAVGTGGGILITHVLNRVTFPGGLHPIVVIASAVLVFALASVLQGSGFLAAYLAGLLVGNRPVRAFASILSFHDAATWFAQLVMFIMLGLLVTPSELITYAVPALILAVFLILIGRPVAVWLCLWPFRFSRNEKLFISWVGLRGAVSIFLAAIPILSGLPNAELYFNVAFFVVLVSLVLQGWTVTFAAKRLGIALSDPAPDIQRFEIDVPGQLEVEMVGYPIVADSPVLDRSTLPHWIKPVFVVRGGEVLTPEQAGALRVGDYGYFLAQPMRVARLDRWFAKRDNDASDHPGVFTFGGDVPLSSVTNLYGLQVPEDLRECTIAEAFEDRFEDRLQQGDRIALGPATLVATAVEGETLITAALELVEKEVIINPQPQPIASLLDNPRRFVRRLGGGS